jgi:putative ABC transport system permease protein
MKFSQAFKMAFMSLKGNKMRSFLTMLGIIIGVLAVTLLITIIQGATDEITGQVEGLGSNLLIVQITSPKDTYLTKEDVAVLTDHDEISGVTVSKSSPAKVKAGTNSENATVEGITETYNGIMNLKIINGRFLASLDIESKSKNAVIGYGLAQDLYGTTNCVGNDIKIKGKNFTVVGVLEESDSMISSSDQTAFIPIVTYQRMFSDKQLSGIYFSASSSDSVDAAEKIIDDYMLKQTGDEDYYEIINQSAILDVMDDVLGVMTSLLAGIAGISLLVGGIGIMNIMLVSVSERTREIGIRKAIGAQKSDIMTQFLIESVVLSVCGGLIGLIIGFIGLEIFEGLMDFVFTLRLSTAALALGFSATVGIVFGLYPANTASNLKPIDALRYE